MRASITSRNSLVVSPTRTAPSACPPSSRSRAMGTMLAYPLPPWSEEHDQTPERARPG
jgi:hypothetical protein